MSRLSHPSNRGSGRLSLLVILLLPLMALAGVSRAATYYVDMDGIGGPSSDGNPGTISQPFKTIEKARDTIRTTGDDGVTVYIRGGIYYLSQPLAFDSRDSGSSGASNVYRGYPGETPKIKASLQIPYTDFRTHSGSIVKADLSGYSLTDVRQVFLNDKRLVLARVPNYDAGDPIGGGFLMFASDSPGTTTQFRWTAGDVDPTSWTNITKIQANTFTYYANQLSYISSIDVGDRLVTLKSPTHWGMTNSYRYYFQNVFEELDAENEWYWNSSTKTLYLWPPHTLTAADSISIPIAQNCATLSGADFISLQNLTIAECNDVGAYVDDCDTAEIKNCTIINTRGKGIWLHDAVNSRIDGCTIYETGSRAIEIENDKTRFFKPLVVCGNVITNCTIHDTGQFDSDLEHGAVRCWSLGNTISWNHIYNTPRCGIFIWGNNNIVEYNHVHDNNQKSFDAGGIYVYGASWVKRGNIIRYNYVHDTGGYQFVGGHWHSYPYNTYGIYLDDWASGNQVLYNTVKTTWYAGVMVHGGRDNRIEHNVFAAPVNGPAVMFSEWAVTNNGYDTMWTELQDVLKSQNGWDGAKYLARYPEIADIPAPDPPSQDHYFTGNTFRYNTVVWPGANAREAYRIDDINVATTTWDGNYLWPGSRTLEVNYNGSYIGLTAWQGYGFDRLAKNIETSLNPDDYLLLVNTEKEEKNFSLGSPQYCDVNGVGVTGLVPLQPFESRVLFAVSGYTLNLVTEGGAVLKTPDKSYYGQGETVTLEAVPTAGHSFASWTGDLSGSTNPATLVMNGNKSVTAGFTAAAYTLTITAVNGSVTKTPSQASYAYGAVVTLQAVPSTGYSFSGWSGDASGTNSSVTVTMNGDKSVTASFTANTYTLTTAGTNGSVVKVPQKASYSYGEVVTLQAVPSPGYSFSGWSGDASGPTNPATVTMTGNKSVTAGFTAAAYTLTITAVNGSVTKSPDQGSYTYDESVSLQAVAQTAYEFTGWSGDLSGATNPATLVMDSDKSVTASFKAVTPDNAPPTLYGFSPQPDTIQVPLNSLVLLHISDDGKGVDANTVTIAVNGTTAYTGNVPSYPETSGICRRIGSKADYTYVYQAENDFAFDQKVTVTVNAADLAGNVLPEYSYSFTTEMRAFGRNLKASTGLANLEKGRPATVRDSVGDIWAVWQAGAAGQRDIYLSKLARGNDSFGDPVRLTAGSGDESNPDVAIGADNRLYVVWQDNRRGSWDVYVRTSSDGVAWSGERRITDSNDNQVNPVIIVDAQSPSRAYIAWQDDGAGNQDIYVASSNDGFVTKVISQVTSDALDQTGPKMAVDFSNTVYLVWTDPRNGSDDIYGASSVVGPWTNVPVVTGTGHQNSPAIATEAAGAAVHIAWVDDASGNQDIHYAFSNGLPASPSVGMNLVDDARGANQTAPTIATVGSAGHGLKVFVCWRDERNITAQGGDADLYFVEVRTPAATNILIGDGGAGSDQCEPALGIDSFGYPYVVWTDSRNPAKDIYYCGSTFMEEEALDSRLASASVGATVGVAPPAKAEDASIVIPANACPYDVTVTIRRMQNLQSGLVPCISSCDFGPSGLDFDVPVTITIPYSVGAYNSTPLLPYWHDSQMNMLSQQGITDVETLQISPTVRAVRFKATHFTPYVLLPAATGASGGGGGGCSLSADGESDPYGYFVPYGILAVVMGILRLRGSTRYSTSHGSPRRGRT